MHKSLITITAVFLLALPISANADNGVITKASAYSADATTQRLEAAIKSRGFMVFGRLNHAAAAKDFGLSMPYSIVVVLGTQSWARRASYRTRRLPSICLSRRWSGRTRTARCGSVTTRPNTCTKQFMRATGSPLRERW